MKRTYRTMKPILHKNSTSGSAALEYVIVSGFALVVSVTAVTWIGSIIKSKMNQIAQRIHSDSPDIDLDFNLGPEPTP
jgi:hypothetical protein